jgi:REP element-mobilizing transposase RayT
MANTYTQIHIQAVFAVQNRDCVIRPAWKSDLYKYITGIVQKNNHKMLAINGMPDHVHIFFGMRPDQSLSDLMQHIKSNSSKWINEKEFIKERFSWQEGYGGFSYRKSDVPSVIQYIRNQEVHHKKVRFFEEYKNLLSEFEIDYDERYMFKPIDYLTPDGTFGV